MHSCNLVLDEDCPQAVPYPASKGSGNQLDMPTDFLPAPSQVLRDPEVPFEKQLERTSAAEHPIDTRDAAPVKVPSCPIPFHFKDRVHRQPQEMTRESIIRPSSRTAHGVPLQYMCLRPMGRFAFTLTMSNSTESPRRTLTKCPEQMGHS